MSSILPEGSDSKSDERDDSSDRADGTALIAAERRRQIEVEGWTPEHDAHHSGDDLAMAAACYALPPRSGGRGYGEDRPPFSWPWDARYWKPTAR